MVNRWNKSMAVGLRHNHDLSFIGTQRKTMALVFYLTNYATKIEDPMWKRLAAAAEVLKDPDSRGIGTTTGEGQMSAEGGRVRTRQFLNKIANRVFTERSVSQVEVIASLLGYRSEFTRNDEWTFLNASGLYWEIFRRWPRLQQASNRESDESVDETIQVRESGQKPTLVQAYPHRGELLWDMSLYDYMSVVKLKRKQGGGRRRKGEIEFVASWNPSESWVQALRSPDKRAHVCFDGYLGVDFGEEDELWHKR
jgi:hypothetical protein